MVNNNSKYNNNSVRPLSEFLKDYPTFEQFVVSMYAAFRLCIKNKASSPSALEFCAHKAENMLSLCRAVYNFEYIPKASIAFIVSVPTYREVIAADFADRIVQHWVAARIEPILEKILDKHVYSCRVGKGNLAAVEAVEEEIFRKTNGYRQECAVASFDLKSFFMSIDKRILYDRLVSLINEHYHEGDKDILLYLTRVIVFALPQENAIRHSPDSEWEKLPKRKSLYHLPWYLGLPIGNLPSQHNANFYNSPAMHYIRSLGLTAINYVDDFYLVAKTKEQITQAMPYIRNYYKEHLGVAVHPDKFYLQPSSHGIKVLGGVVKYGRKYISNRTVSHLWQRMHAFNLLGTHYWRRRRFAEKYAATINSYFGIMRRYATYNIRKQAAEEIAQIWGDVLLFDQPIEKAVVRHKHCPIYHTRKWHRQRLQTYNNIAV